MRGRVAPWWLALGVLAPGSASGQMAGHVGVEARAFAHDPLFPQQRDQGVSLDARPRFDLDLGRGWRLDLELFGRLDSADPERTHADVRELAVSGTLGPWDLYGGVGAVFWGVTESRHLVDVVNQTDLVEDVEEEDKLGQPMLRVARSFPWGRLSATGLFGFRERTFPGPEGRLRGPLPVSGDAVVAGGDAFDLTLRWSHVLGAWDVAASYFDGIDRAPRFEPAADGARLNPVYEGVRRWAVELQRTEGDWLWKAEGLLARPAEQDAWAAAVFGFEVTLWGALGAADLGLLAEAHLDSRGRGAPTPFGRDLFVGSRLALNDVASTTLLWGALVDVESGAAFWLVEGERRVAARWTMELRGRGVGGTDGGDPLHALRRDDHLALTLRFHF